MNMKKYLAGLALTAATAMASAAPWTQTIDFNPDVYIGPTFTWTHDLTTGGFDPGIDEITNFSLSVTIADDASDRDQGFFRGETGFLDVHDSLLSDRILLNPIGTTTTGGALLAIFELNLDGTLGVSLSSTFGDFLLTSATMTATGRDGSRVPEPSSLALVGLALAGVALRRRQRREA